MVYEFAPKQKNPNPIWICAGDNFISDDGCFVEIKPDYDCDNPRECELGTFYTWLNDYSSPDEAPTLEELFDEFNLWDEWDKVERGNPVAWFAAKLNELWYVSLPVAAYIHSGIVYRVGTLSQFPDSQWDAGYAGVIFVSEEKIRKELMVPEVTAEVRARVNRYLADEVEYFSAWAEGQTYGFVKYDRYGDEVDSCWGFIGYDAVQNGMVDYAGMLEETSMSLDDWVELMELEDDEEDEIIDEVLGGLTAEYESYAA